MGDPLAAGALALLALAARDNQEMEWQLKAAERALDKQPRHWTWVFVGLMRAIRAAQERNEPRTRAWWSVAREHGLAQLRTPDLWLPLQRLVEASAAAGWTDISQSAWRISNELGSEAEEVAAEDLEVIFDPEAISDEE